MKRLVLASSQASLGTTAPFAMPGSDREIHEANMTAFLSVFLAVFLAELGDKTQLATVLFASDGERSRVLVFAAASLALIASTCLAIILGAAAERHFGGLPLKLIAGAGFLAIGIWMIGDHFLS